MRQGKERMLRGEEDASVLYIYIQHNEHQTLLERGGKREGGK
jgi:hypothetical protein